MGWGLKMELLWNQKDPKAPEQSHFVQGWLESPSTAQGHTWVLGNPDLHALRQQGWKGAQGQWKRNEGNERT